MTHAITHPKGQLRPRVMVVDDEVTHMHALCDTLRDHVEEIVGLSSARQALEVLQHSHFDLLLTDLIMTEMDGITLLRAARETDANLVPIIMTGAGTLSTAIEAMKAGAQDYILKPLKLSVILPVLSRALEVRNLRIENVELQGHLRQRGIELEVANRELQLVNSELEAFSQTVSHELLTPLASVIGFAELLQREYTVRWGDDERELFAYLIDNARDMRQLIADLLRFSRLSRQTLNVRIVDMNELVRDVLNELQPHRQPYIADLHVANLPGCLGDRALLRQIYVNLLSNAVKYTRKRQAASIEIGSYASDEGTVYFVRDNGAGFDMQHADKLFSVFQRLHREDEFEGTGVGLSIVQRVVQRHGGRIWAQAEVDRGATFFFTLPGL